MTTGRGRLGSHPVAVWAIKHVVSPLDRAVVRMFRGRLRQPSSIVLPTLLLTTRGRLSGEERTIPLIYIRDGDRFVVANARPAGERHNPWVANLRAAGAARVKLRGQAIEVEAHELDESQLDQWWPQLCDVWPAFAAHFEDTGDRTAFALVPTRRAAGPGGRQPPNPGQ